MARIRTVKPEFWTDEKIVQLPFEARLLFIGLWNIADDEGKLEYSPMRIKMQLFPADKVDTHSLIEKIAKLDLIVIYEVEHKLYISIPHFLQHQRVSHPAISTLPNPPVSSGKLLPEGNIEEGKGIEGKGTDKEIVKEKQTFGEFKNVLLTDEEYKKLIEKFGELAASDKIQNLSEALKSKKGYAQKYTDHYATILSWARIDIKRNGGQNNGRIHGQVVARNEKPTGIKIIE